METPGQGAPAPEGRGLGVGSAPLLCELGECGQLREAALGGRGVEARGKMYEALVKRAAVQRAHVVMPQLLARAPVARLAHRVLVQLGVRLARAVAYHYNGCLKILI